MRPFKRPVSVMKASLWTVCILACGCGYQEYMNKFEDTLAMRDYLEKVEQALGPRYNGAEFGFSARFPKELPPEPEYKRPPPAEDDEAEPTAEEPAAPPAENGDDVPSAKKVDDLLAAIFNTPADASKPMRVVVYVSRKTEDADLLTLEELTQHVFEQKQLSRWMGPGLELKDGKLELQKRDVKAGPLLKDGSQKLFPVQWVTLQQKAPQNFRLPMQQEAPGLPVQEGNANPADPAALPFAPLGDQPPPDPDNADNLGQEPKPAQPLLDANAAPAEGPVKDFTWLLFFLDQGDVRAMVGYRVLKDDYALLSDPIDMSVTTVTLFPAAVKSASKGRGEPAAPADAKAAPKGKRRGG